MHSRLNNWLKKIRFGQSMAVVIAAIAMVLSPLGAIAGAIAASTRDQQFDAAASEFKVPKKLLMAISYNQTRWENHDGQPSASGGYGLMHLTTTIKTEDGRGDPARPVTPTTSNKPHTLDEAASTLNTSTESLKMNDRQNIRGGAALLAKYAKESNQGRLPTTDEGWQNAISRLSGLSDPQIAAEFTANVYDTLQQGAQNTTSDGQTLGIAPGEPGTFSFETFKHKQPRWGESQSEAECPRSIVCKYVPAHYAQNDPDNPFDYGNYDPSNRPRDMKIKYIVIHDMEGSYQSSIDWFKNPASYVSAHYLIRSSDGEVTQMVKNKNVGWHAANWYVNMHSIGIEHEGFAAEGATWYTEAMYRSSAKLVRYLAKKYDIPLDREHIIGHDQYHSPAPERAASMHWDPGPYWDWNHYMDLLHGKPNIPDYDSKVVTISPKFEANQPVVTKCEGDNCTQLPAQPTNFVYLRTEPRQDASLITDAGMHPDGSPGTTEISDWSAKATSGQHFAVADRKGDWTAIWFGGQKAWFYNPYGQGRTAFATKYYKLVTPRGGKETIPLYGRPLPETSAYHSGVPVQSIVPLQYTIAVGQYYPAYEKRTINDYFHAFTFDLSSPGDGTVVVGHEKYIPISFNHRQAYVKASDVWLARN